MKPTGYGRRNMDQPPGARPSPPRPAASPRLPEWPFQTAAAALAVFSFALVLTRQATDWVGVALAFWALLLACGFFLLPALLGLAYATRRPASRAAPAATQPAPAAVPAVDPAELERMAIDLETARASLQLLQDRFDDHLTAEREHRAAQEARWRDARLHPGAAAESPAPVYTASGAVRPGVNPAALDAPVPAAGSLLHKAFATAQTGDGARGIARWIRAGAKSED